VILYGCKRSLQSSSIGDVTREQLGDSNVVKSKTAIILPIVASLALIVIFFFIYAFYVVLVLMTIASLMSLLFVITPYTRQVCLAIKREPINVRLPLIGLVGLHSIITLVLAAGIITLWMTTNSWLIINGIGICIGITALSILKLQSLKVSSILLILFFFYDIFWVFISDKIFKKNVMISVATSMTSQSISLPMLLQFPTMLSDNWSGITDIEVPSVFLSFIYRWMLLNDYGLGQRSSLMVGMGDIVLPGIFLNFLYRYDHHKGRSLKNGYFLIGIIGYIAGVELTQLFLLVLQRGEPALLFIVPCILIPIVIAGKLRNNLKNLWSGISQPIVHREEVPIDSTENALLNNDEQSELEHEEITTNKQGVQEISKSVTFV